MRSGWATIAAFAMAAGCVRGPENAAPIAPGPTVPEKAPTSSADAGRTLPPADAIHRYIGRWAPDVRQCKDGFWTFEERRLSAPNRVTCVFEHVNAVPGGYDVAAACLVEGTTTGDTIKLRFAESARAMLIESKTFGSLGLIFCGRPTAEASAPTDPAPAWTESVTVAPLPRGRAASVPSTRMDLLDFAR